MSFANLIDNELVDDDGLALTELPFAERISSRFAAQVTWLASQIGDVPLGWHPIYRNAMRGLRAIACEKRDGIEFSEPVSVRGALTVAVYYAITDKVASGILFKLSKRSECTCQDCGRAYGVRFRKYNQQTLCNKCHVRASLKAELSNWVGRRFAYNEHPFLEFDALPPNIQLLFPRNKIRTLHLESNGEKIEYVTVEELRKQTPRLEAMKQYLDATKGE
jgi:hypothetical protein